AAHGGFAIAEHVPREAGARRDLDWGDVKEVRLVILDPRVGQAARGIRRGIERALPNEGEDRAGLWIDRDLVRSGAGGGGHRDGAGRIEQLADLARIVGRRVEQAQAGALRVQVADAVEAQTVVEGQAAGGLEGVLQIPFDLRIVRVVDEL